MSETDNTPEVQKQNTREQKETFSREYVNELREESKSHRIKNAEYEKKFNELESKFKQRDADYEKTVSDLTVATKNKLIKAEVKSHAIKNGIVDLDALKVLDFGVFKFDEETGEIENADDVFKKLKTDKSWMFQATANTSSGAIQPKVAASGPLDAMKMSPEQFRAHRRKIEEQV